jgi:hypothetical protein
MLDSNTDDGKYLGLSDWSKTFISRYFIFKKLPNEQIARIHVILTSVENKITN